MLVALQKRLNHLPKRSQLLKPAEQAGVTAFEVMIGVLFTFAAAAYWIFERDKTIDLVCSCCRDRAGSSCATRGT